MKVAISIPDPTFKQADAEAKRRKWTRSRLYATALEAFLRKQQDDLVREKLNEIYSVEDSRLPEGLEQAQAEILRRQKW